MRSSYLSFQQQSDFLAILGDLANTQGKYTEKAIAVWLGISRTTWRGWQEGSMRLRHQTAARLRKHLGLDGRRLSTIRRRAVLSDPLIARWLKTYEAAHTKSARWVCRTQVTAAICAMFAERGMELVLMSRTADDLCSIGIFEPRQPISSFVLTIQQDELWTQLRRCSGAQDQLLIEGPISLELLGVAERIIRVQFTHLRAAEKKRRQRFNQKIRDAHEQGFHITGRANGQHSPWP